MLSMASIETDYPNIHITGGLSKDFGLNGLRVGILYTKNENVIKGMGGIGYFEGVSNVTQHILTKVFSDDEWLENYIQTNR